MKAAKRRIEVTMENMPAPGTDASSSGPTY